MLIFSCNACFIFKYLYSCKPKEVLPFVLDIDQFIVKSVTSSITYSQSVSNCQNDGKRLCNAKEICRDEKTPVSGEISGDHWVPINDDPNEWIQIGMEILHDKF